MRTELSMKMEKLHLPIPIRFCKFVRACLDIASDEEMYSTLNNLQIISITGEVSCCSVFYEDIKTKQEFYIKTMHIIKTFEKLYKEKIENSAWRRDSEKLCIQLLPKIREEYEQRELVNTCTNPFVTVPQSSEEQWKSMPYFAAFPYYINQVGLYDLRKIWLESKSPTTKYLILDDAYRVILGVFPEKARNGIVEKLCKLEWKLKAKERSKSTVVSSSMLKTSWNSAELLNGKRIDYEKAHVQGQEATKYTINFQTLDLWNRMLLVVIQEGQAIDHLTSALKLELMNSFFPKSIALDDLPFALHVPKPPSTRPKKAEVDELPKKDNTPAVTKLQEYKDVLQKTDDKSAMTNCQDFSRQSQTTQAVLRKEDQLSQESCETVKVPYINTKSLHTQKEVSKGNSAVPRSSLKKPKSSPVYRTTSMPHVPMECKTMKPATKASKSSVINLTPRDIPLIVDTPRE